MTAPNHPRTAPLGFAASGDNTAIAAVTGQALVIWKIALTTHAAVTVTFASGAGTGTPLGVYEFTTAGSLVLDGPEGFELYRTAIGALFNMSLSGAVQVNGTVWYTYG